MRTHAGVSKWGITRYGGVAQYVSMMMVALSMLFAA